MKFDLRKPCANCPFRTDCPPAWLGHDHAKGIAEAVSGGNTFQCHKTRNTAPQMCAGALIGAGVGWWRRNHRLETKGEKIMPLIMYVIYDHPRDCPTHWVVRRWIVGTFSDKEPRPAIFACACDTLAQAQASIPDGLINLGIEMEDDPCIAEVWF